MNKPLYIEIIIIKQCVIPFMSDKITPRELSFYIGIKFIYDSINNIFMSTGKAGTELDVRTNLGLFVYELEQLVELIIKQTILENKRINYFRGRLMYLLAKLYNRQRL